MQQIQVLLQPAATLKFVRIKVLTYSIYPDTFELASWSILTSSFMLKEAEYAGSAEVAVKCCNFEETMLQIAITEEILTEFG